jgi:hypothetical protein
MKNVKKTEIMAIVIILFKNEKDLVLKLAKHKNIRSDYKIDMCCFSAHSVKEKEQRLVGLESG